MASGSTETTEKTGGPRVTQFSVFLPNKVGALLDVVKLLNERGVDVLALAVQDSADTAIVRIVVSDPEVLTFVASRVSTNIRELEGALTRVLAFSSLTGRRMDVELAQDVLRDVFPQGDGPAVTIDRIQRLVCERFAVSVDEITGDRRTANVVYPRQVAMYLARELTDSSLPKIGREFGGRDHTTVIHATSKIHRLIREDRSVYNLIQELTARIKQAR